MGWACQGYEAMPLVDSSLFQENLQPECRSAGSSDTAVLVHQSAWHHTSQVRLISEYACHAVTICFALQGTEVLNLESTFIAILVVYKLFHFSYFELGFDTLYSGITVLPLKMKTLFLSAMVLHTYQTAECHMPEDNNWNGYQHTVSNLLYFLCVLVSSTETDIKLCDINCNRFSTICGEDVAQQFGFICPSLQLTV